jgi:hypothetical protein
MLTATPAHALPPSGQAQDPVCVLRWTFRKGSRSITCQLENNVAASSYDVFVIPHWDIGSTVVEGTTTPIEALRRHAQIARGLRAAGWALDRRAR